MRFDKPPWGAIPAAASRLEFAYPFSVSGTGFLRAIRLLTKPLGQADPVTSLAISSSRPSSQPSCLLSPPATPIAIACLRLVTFLPLPRLVRLYLCAIELAALQAGHRHFVEIGNRSAFFDQTCMPGDQHGLATPADEVSADYMCRQLMSRRCSASGIP